MSVGGLYKLLLEKKKEKPHTTLLPDGSDLDSTLSLVNGTQPFWKQKGVFLFLASLDGEL